MIIWLPPLNHFCDSLLLTKYPSSFHDQASGCFSRQITSNSLPLTLSFSHMTGCLQVPALFFFHVLFHGFATLFLPITNTYATRMHLHTMPVSSSHASWSFVDWGQGDSESVLWDLVHRCSLRGCHFLSFWAGLEALFLCGQSILAWDWANCVCFSVSSDYDLLDNRDRALLIFMVSA
jgi:hypothetical protein